MTSDRDERFSFFTSPWRGEVDRATSAFMRVCDVLWRDRVGVTLLHLHFHPTPRTHKNKEMK
jgi:hypothetical protein